MVDGDGVGEEGYGAQGGEGVDEVAGGSEGEDVARVRREDIWAGVV